ncbi:MAG: hypothetical protein ACI9H8_001876 [Lysobacterales bacterium]|jgi:hypothetical protein
MRAKYLTKRAWFKFINNEVNDCPDFTHNLMAVFRLKLI